MYFRKAIIIAGWVLLAFLAYKVSQFDYESASFDPYDILNVPIVSIANIMYSIFSNSFKICQGTNEKVIKKAYRRLSLIYHPDKETGDEKKFMKLTKGNIL